MSLTVKPWEVSLRSWAGLEAWLAGARFPPSYTSSFALLWGHGSATEQQPGTNHSHLLCQLCSEWLVHTTKRIWIVQIFFLTCMCVVILRASFLFESWLCTELFGKCFLNCDQTVQEPSVCVFTDNTHKQSKGRIRPPDYSLQIIQLALIVQVSFLLWRKEQGICFSVYFCSMSSLTEWLLDLKIIICCR